MGKTTTIGKIGYQFRKKKVLFASCDIYRPAAREQLKILAQKADVQYFECDSSDPMTIAKKAKIHAENHLCDYLFIDTAGRLEIDQKMMDEAEKIHQAIRPHYRIFTVDAMAGQSTLQTVKKFNKQIPINGLVMTKADADTRGGALISAYHVTEAPILYIGQGERIDQIEVFDPQKIVKSILGMESIFEQIEQISQKPSKPQEPSNRFTLDTFLSSLEQFNQTDGMTSLIGKFAGNKKVNPKASENLQNQIQAFKAAIQSMTKDERNRPQIIKASRKLRIAKGSGRTVQEVNLLLKQYEMMSKLFKKNQKRQTKF